jgi:hypothetical protein
MPFPLRTPRSPLTRLLVHGCTLSAALALASCTRNLNMEPLRKSVADGLASQLGLAGASVECPESRPIKAGDSFECTATPSGGGRLTVRVSQKDDSGNISWDVVKTEGLLDLGKVEGSIVTGLREQARVEATVSCGGRWRAAKAGDTFECEAKAPDGQAIPIVVSVADTEGNISWKTK